MKKILKRANIARGDYQRAGFAYAMSKNFVCWYAAKCAFEYGKKGIRVVSLSPGLIATDMGNAEKENGAYLIDFVAEEKNEPYLCDHGRKKRHCNLSVRGRTGENGGPG